MPALICSCSKIRFAKNGEKNTDKVPIRVMTATAHVISFLLFMTELAAIIAVIPHTASRFLINLSFHYLMKNKFKTLIKIKIKTKFKTIIKKILA